MSIDPAKNFFKTYVLSNGSLYLFRFVNTSFGSKWAGLWNFDKKLLDYWAFKINEEWLSIDNCIEFEHKLWCACHRHELKNFLVTEEIVPCREGFLILLKIKNKSNSRLHAKISLEVGVNIRFRDTGIHDRRYSVKTKRNFVRVWNEVGEVWFGSLKGNFLKNEIYARHFPGRYAESCGYVVKQNVRGSWCEDEQSKFVPGEYVAEADINPNEETTVPFFFSNSEMKDYKEYREWVTNSKGRFERFRGQYSNSELAEVLDKTVSSLLTYETDDGYVAGYPFFNEIWVRDACWCLPAYLYLGMFGHVKKFLRLVGRKIKSGRVPVVINSKTSVYNASDTTPLWVIGVYDYLDFTGDTKFMKFALPKLKEILEFGKSMIRDGLVEDDGYTWMDTLKRVKPIDLEALWCRAFYCGGKLLSLSNKEGSGYIKLSSKLLKEIENNYWSKEVKDNLGNDFKSPNFIFQLALMDVHRDVSRYLEKIMSEEYLTPVGIRSRSLYDENYNPRGYHTGMVWPFLTLTSAIAQGNYEKTENLRKLMEINISNFDKQCINGINEIFEADSLKPRGCVSQAWSVAGIITLVDAHILGIRPKLTEKMVILDPSKFFLKEFKRSIKIGKGRASLHYIRRENKIELKLRSMPAVTKIPNTYHTAIVNDKRIEDEVITLKPKKQHTLILKTD